MLVWAARYEIRLILVLPDLRSDAPIQKFASLIPVGCIAPCLDGFFCCVMGHNPASIFPEPPRKDLDVVVTRSVNMGKKLTSLSHLNIRKRCLKLGNSSFQGLVSGH